MKRNRLDIKYDTTAVSNSGGVAITGSGWVYAVGGTWGLATNLSSKVMVLPLPAMNAGDVIKEIRLIGAIGAATSNATVLDVDFKKVTHGAAGAVTTSTIASMTQISKTADYVLDDAITPTTPETAAEETSYFLVITGTTANNANCDITIAAVEVVVAKHFGTPIGS